MGVAAYLYPSLALVALLFVLLGRLATMRVGAIRRREVKMRDIALGQKNWSIAAVQAGNCVDNQFQLPVLFHVLTGFEIITAKADLAFLVLGWLFVASRVLHAAIHVGSNDVVRRFYAFAAGFAILIVAWVLFAIKLIAGF